MENEQLNNENYQSPEVLIWEVLVESGYASSVVIDNILPPFVEDEW